MGNVKEVVTSWLLEGPGYCGEAGSSGHLNAKEGGLKKGCSPVRILAIADDVRVFDALRGIGRCCGV